MPGPIAFECRIRYARSILEGSVQDQTLRGIYGATPSQKVNRIAERPRY